MMILHDSCHRPRMRHNHPFYYCKEHAKVQNIYSEVIESNLIRFKDHKKENEIDISMNNTYENWTL